MAKLSIVKWNCIYEFKLQWLEENTFSIFAAPLEEIEASVGLSENLLPQMKVHWLSVEEEFSRCFPDVRKLFPC